MLKKIILHFWSMRRQFARYFIVGFSALFLDVGSLYVLSDLWHVIPYVAIAINGVFMINYVFFLNKYWTFKSTGVTHKQIVRFFILSAVNYVISVSWMYLFNEKLGINHLIARVSNIALAVAWNFVLYKYWVYKSGTQPATIENVTPQS
jgi:putative flippase GtrA